MKSKWIEIFVAIASVSLIGGAKAFAQIGEEPDRDNLDQIEAEIGKATPAAKPKEDDSKNQNPNYRNTDVNPPAIGEDGPTSQMEVNKNSDLNSLAPFSEVSILQKKFMPKTGRFQAFGGGAIITNDPWNYGLGFGGRLGYHFTEEWGFEANFHNNKPTQDSTVYERTYEVGPRIYVNRGGFSPYAKALYGRGVYNFHNGIANVGYNIYTFGGGVDFAVRRSLNVRADYEYQTWPGFPLGTLHPGIVTIGVAFHFHE